jgi:hypothetical protein
MPGTFPKIKHCVVCEGVRPELGNKATVLGFFGLAPDVDIVLPSLPATVQLCFMLLTGEGNGQTYAGVISISAPDGKQLAKAEMPEIAVPATTPEATGRGILVIGFPSVTFSLPGEHTLMFSVDGNMNYQNKFLVRNNAQLHKSKFS